MSQTFAAVARVSAAVATGRLGWSPEAFWRATPGDLWLALADPDPGGAAGGVTPGSLVSPASRVDLKRMMERIDHDR